VVKLGNEVAGFRIVFENVVGILQGRPYDGFQKITHIPILQNFATLEFMILKCTHF
jgi:hypothetical protein